ncbi:MAG: hypothetical protein SGILL_001075 [Bacillariaceae sp.]
MVLCVVCLNLEKLDSVNDFTWEGLENFCEFTDNSGDHALDLAEEMTKKKAESGEESDPEGLNLTPEERKRMEEQVENDPLTMKIRGFSARSLQWETDEKNKIVEEASEKMEVAFNGTVYYVNKCYHHQQPNGTNVILGISKFTRNEKKAICRLIVKFSETLMGADLEEIPPVGVPATYDEEDQTGIPSYVKVWEEPGLEPIVPLSSLKPCTDPSDVPGLMFEPQRLGQPPHNFGYVYERDGTNRGKERKEIRTVELFAGSGGFHQGVMQEPGFKGIAAVEYWDKAVDTFKHNCKDPYTKVYLQKVEDFLDEFGPTPTEFEEAHGKIDVLFASPPCQSFSGSNRDVDHNGEKDLYRKGLSLKFFDANQTSGALIGVFENVEGMWRRPNIYFLKKIVFDHLRAGWQVRVGLHRAHKYGDPQARPRLVILAAKKFVEMPKMTETHGPGRHPFMTVGNAFKALDQTLEDVEKNPDTMKAIPNLEGANLKKCDKEEEVLKANKPAGTIRAGGRAWHPTKDRAITVREAATLQSYPYEYEFKGTLTDQYKQVGNAVPGKMAKAIARAVKESLRFVYDEENEDVLKKDGGNVSDFDLSGDEDDDEEMAAETGNKENAIEGDANIVASTENEIEKEGSENDVSAAETVVMTESEETDPKVIEDVDMTEADKSSTASEKESTEEVDDGKMEAEIKEATESKETETLLGKNEDDDTSMTKSEIKESTEEKDATESDVGT